MTTKYVSSLQPNMFLVVKKETKVEVTVDVDRRILDKTTGEIRKEKRTVVVPKENWKFYIKPYNEVTK